MIKTSKSSVVPDEISRFSHHAREWWSENGAMRPLHRLNPTRIAYIRDQIFGLGLGKSSARQPFKNISLLDLGCGGGLLTEPMARLGAKVTGLDASAEVIKEAKRHAKISGLDIDYRIGSVEDLARSSQRFDVITALEIVEHVANLDEFIGALSKLLKPKGLLIVSTLNRTPKSFLLGIVAAEYILRWVPQGTHRWSKFLRPSEVVKRFDACGLKTIDLTGIIYNPLLDEFTLSKNDLDVNYMVTAVKG